mgnify:CR=1 FL=1
MFDKCYSYSKEALALCKTRYLWVLNAHCDYSHFDFSWEPAPWEKNFRHAFASQWQKDSGTYLVPKAGYTETKYNTDNTVIRLPDVTKWDSMDSDFDYSWHHDVTEPPYVYQFGTQHQTTGGPRYTVAGAESTKFVGDITPNFGIDEIRREIEDEEERMEMIEGYDSEDSSLYDGMSP